MAGIHRYAIEPAGFTALACAVATIVEGSLGGFLKKSLDKSKNRVEFALYAGMFAELIQMAIILLIARPFPAALRLVRVIAFMTAVSVTYIMMAEEGFKLSQTISYPVGIVSAVLAIAIFLVKANSKSTVDKPQAV